MRVFLSRVWALVSGRTQDAEFDQEVQNHLAMATEENLRKGMSPEEARRAAVERFGAISQIKEDQHDRRSLPQIGKHV